MDDVVATVLDNARAGRFAEIREMFAPNLRPMVPVETLSSAWGAAVARLGEVTGSGTARVEDKPGGRVVRLDVRGYDPVATAAGLAVPMLFVQGGRDYQVTLGDDSAQ